MFNQDADKPFNTAVHNTVNHDRPMLLTIFANIVQVKFFRHLHIQLNRTALPGTANRIPQMEVYFRAVKSAIAFIDFIIHAPGLKRVPQGTGGNLPHFSRAHCLVRLRTQLRMIRQAENAIDGVEQVNNLLNLLLDL